MPLKNSLSRYGTLAQLFHWSIFLLFVFMYVVADAMEAAPKGPEKWELYALHKSTGMLILLIVFLRLSWRMANPVPVLPDTLGPAAKLAARYYHWALYAVMLIMPISGYFMSVMNGHSVPFFGFFVFPEIVGENKTIGGLAHGIHYWCHWAIYALVVGHILAALHHHFIRRDDILLRMLPKCSSKKDTS